MSTVRRWRPALPCRCVLCGGWDTAPLCRACSLRFASPRPRCPRCALPQPGGEVCGACLQRPPAWASAVTVADYAFPWDRLIGGFKFRQRPELAGVLAPLLVQAVARAQAGATPATGVVPVPLSRARLAERGYNQAWELARRVGRSLTLPGRPDALLRLRDTPHQVGLDRAHRLDNLTRAFWVPPAGEAWLHGRHVALVDDVVTTGVTAEACCQALLAAGAASVQLWMLARTPAPGDASAGP